MSPLVLIFLQMPLLLLAANECDEKRKCASGLRCEEGECVLRFDCPAVSMPVLRKPCKMRMEPNEQDCPMPKVECSNKCGSTTCESGFECDESYLKCVPRTDCPLAFEETNPREGCVVNKSYSLPVAKAEEPAEQAVKMGNLKKPPWVFSLEIIAAVIPIESIVVRSVLSSNSMLPRCVGNILGRCQVSFGMTATVSTPLFSAGCAKNAEWRECTNVCGEKSCDTMLTVSPCFSLRCGAPGCACKEGHVLLSKENAEQGCVTRETCRKLAAAKKLATEKSTNS